MKKTVCLIVLSTLNASALMAKLDAAQGAPVKKCTAPPKVRGATLAQCEQSAKVLWKYFETCSESPPTYFAKDVDEAQDECFRQVMVRQLDKRLLPLKKRDPARFKQEMKLQAIFNQTVNTYCPDSDDSATGGGVSGCGVQLTKYRAQQAEVIHKGQLEIHGTKPVTRQIEAFRAFAAGLCAMPAEVWRERTPPASCVAKVLSAMERALGRHR